MAEYKNATAIKAEIQKICDNCWHPYRLGGCPEHCGINDAVKAIDSAPVVDAVPVRHGQWMEIPEAEMFMCSECGEPGLSFDDVYIYDLKPANFCPNCGADMREDGGNDS